ncbi:hypothetical protein IEQ34_015162 [Dendrobium chrysotoxum]|uniref:Uncharacterized protein n=1 Tax=Dendrobium chrysotoxum TaxID=161865 RepID=A0AAV7GM47_DENCH|nr:hypothetical protein IEQ34_015162 [Dendrobium chrysotoxum]
MPTEAWRLGSLAGADPRLGDRLSVLACWLASRSIRAYTELESVREMNSSSLFLNELELEHLWKKLDKLRTELEHDFDKRARTRTRRSSARFASFTEVSLHLTCITFLLIASLLGCCHLSQRLLDQELQAQNELPASCPEFKLS